MVRKALEAGAEFPDVYDWTWGEIADYVNAKEQARREKARLDASLYFHTASLITKMLSANKGTKFSVMDTYDFLWSKEEHERAKAEARKQSLQAKAYVPKSLDEQDRMLSELKEKILRERGEL